MRRRLTALVTLAASTLVFCREPTQVTVDIRTDIPCSELHGVTLTTGRADGYEDKAPVTVTPECDASGRIGTLVVVPSGDDTDEVAIKVTAGFGPDDAEACKAPNYGPGCVVARRILRYVPQTSLTLPIFLRRSCAGVPCSPTSTCVDSKCRGAAVQDPSSCTSPEGCDESKLLDGNPTTIPTTDSGPGPGPGPTPDSGSSSDSSAPVADSGGPPGACTVTRANCNDDLASDGCEVDLSTDPNNCGGCGLACSNANMATRTCSGTPGRCDGACAPGFFDCNDDKRGDGCESTSACGGGYTKSTPATPFLDACSLAGMTRYVKNSDDVASSLIAVPAGFAFTFFGKAVTQYWVADNGVMGFGPSSVDPRIHCLPSSANASPAIFAFGDDLETRAGGVCVGVQGAAPNRKLAFTWDDAAVFAGASSHLTFSIVLNETSGIVDIIYQTMSGDADATGGLATVGIQNAGGTVALQHGCKEPGITKPGTAVRFTPP
jgi:hypothetical protein